MHNNLVVPPRIRRLQLQAVAILLLIGLVNVLDRAALSVANPLIREDMGFSILQMGLLLSVFQWSYAFAQLPGGIIVDRAGPRRLLGFSLILWSLAQAACGFIGSMTQFVVARIFLGIGEAPTFTSALRVIRELHHVKHRSLPTAICCSAPSSLGPLIAPPVLTLLMLAFGWRWMFVVLGAAGIIVAVAWFLLYRDVRELSLDAKESRYLEEVGHRPGRKSPSLTDWRRLFRFRATWGLLVGYSGVIYLTWLYQAWLPGYLEIQRHMSLTKTGFVASIPYLFGLIGSFSGGWVSARLIARGVSPINSCKLPVLVGLLGAALCTALAAESQSDTLAVAAISGAVLFGQCASGMSWGLSGMVAPANYTASIGSIQNCGGYLGGALAPIVTGFIVQETGSFIPALLVGAAIAGSAAIVYLVMIPNRPVSLTDDVITEGSLSMPTA